MPTAVNIPAATLQDFEHKVADEQDLQDEKMNNLLNDDQACTLL